MKKLRQTSIDQSFFFGSLWLKFVDANEMTPGEERLGTEGVVGRGRGGVVHNKTKNINNISGGSHLTS